MPVLTFEGVAPPGGEGPVPDGYGGFTWKNVGAVDTTSTDYDESGYVAVANAASPVTAAHNRDGGAASFEVPAGDFAADFTLLSVVAGSAWNLKTKVKFTAYDDGVKVGTKTVTVKYGEAETVLFGSEFASIDKVVFKTKRGTDATAEDDGRGKQVALDDLTFVPDRVIIIDEWPI
jgi:hypothetical protein